MHIACVYRSVVEMQDDCLDDSNISAGKNNYSNSIGTSFRASKIMLMLTWHLNHSGAVITSITVVYLINKII